MEMKTVSTITTSSTDDLEGKSLTFNIGDSIYGVSLFHVLEIISIQSITRVPNVPVYVKGIINLRGKIVPVIDVRLKFNEPERAYDEKTCIVVINMNDMQIGLIVDSVSDVTTMSTGTISKPPEINRATANKYLSSIFKTGNRVVLNIDCEKFFKDNP